ncbi:hypothetical protein RirG_209590 [Rhizophagus irregularis DAOM 197198w]|uniref:Uncharacterized protein n=1 Tax=Rhizophagus irregularis (strain DAOM 197198w) TaxID=1432141 RepID=A0A015ISG9_RHIIW|nr:hypothetical protein RirG_209590 [Rhizophagus irregularis DAOM 197198w]
MSTHEKRFKQEKVKRDFELKILENQRRERDAKERVVAELANYHGTSTKRYTHTVISRNATSQHVP